jgi:hypothetical protein
VVAGRKRMMRILYFVLLLIAAIGTRAEPAQEVSQVSEKVMTVKQSVLELNRDLYQLEEDLLSPATTRASLYFSLAYGEFFEPYSINVSVDDKQTVNYLYTERQVKALRQGGIQPLQDLNLGPGIHHIKAVVKGVDNNGKSRELVIEQEIEKHDQPLYIELKVHDKKEMQSAELLMSQW